MRRRRDDGDEAPGTIDFQREMRRAFERLHRFRTLLELGAPDDAVERARQLVARSRALLGEELWTALEWRLPGWVEIVRLREERDREWARRCLHCAHRPPDAADGLRACYGDGRPMTCPRFRPRAAAS